MNYQTLVTTYGLSKIAQGIAASTPLNFNTMAVGDGNGNGTTPDAAQTSLVRESFRAAVNTVYADPAHPGYYVAEMVIPASITGFTIREVGLFDADGGLVAVANTPAFYKPAAAEGAYSDVVIKLVFAVSNAAQVTVYADPNVVIATREWVRNTVTFASLVPGGTHHQVLRKVSNAAGDVEWAAPDTSALVIDVIEEHQTVAAGQTVINLAQCTTKGLAIYEAGQRVPSDTWTPDPAINTRLTLNTAYPAGTVLIFVQNEPNGHVPIPLERSLNLSDLDNVAPARANLDVYSKAEAAQLTPAGTVIMFAGPMVLPGYLPCNGAELSRTSYAALFANIGTYYGAGNGVSTFNLPDLRGEFVRGLDNGRGVDGGRGLGTFQGGDIQAHNHITRFNRTQKSDNSTNFILSDPNVGENINGSVSLPTSATGGAETRPRNVALNFLIKY